MKKIKILPSILMLTLCIAILGVGVFAIAPTQNTISGSITINASNTPVKIELLENGNLVKTYEEVRGGIDWDVSNLSFNLENANQASDVDDIVLTFRITNLSTTQDLGVYFHTGTLPTADNADLGILAGYASADNILLEDEIFDSTTTTDKIADVNFSPYSYLAVSDGNASNFDVLEMNIKMSLYDLYNEAKTNNFSYQLNIEPYVSNCNTLNAGTIDWTQGGFIPGDNTFNGKLLKIGTNITKIPELAFYNNNSTIEHVVVPSSVNDSGIIFDDGGFAHINSAFEKVSTIKAVSIRRTLLSSELLGNGRQAGFRMFYNCSLMHVKYDGNIIPNAMFEKFNTTNLKNIELSDNLEYIGNFAFGDIPTEMLNEKDGIKYLGIGNNDYYILVDGTNFIGDTPNIHEECKIIYTGAFYNCAKLKTITLPNNIVQIGTVAFAGHYIDGSNLSEINFSSSLKYISNGAFSYCKSLTEIVLPNSLKHLDSYVFDSCTSLEKVYIPSSVTIIDDGLFNPMGSLSAPFMNCSSTLVINCQVTQANKPSGWGEKWNYYGHGTNDYVTPNWGVASPN